MKKIAFVLILIFVCFQAKAQPGGLGGFAYSMGQPTWETKDFINEFSWRGIAIEYKHFNSQSLSYGLQFGWNNFGQRIDEILVFDNGAVSGTQIRKLGVVPILVSVNYHTSSMYSDVCPYLALNAGTYYIQEQYSLGTFGSDKGAWHLALAPEFGIYIPAGDAYLQLALKLNHAFKAGDYLVDGSKEFTWLSLNVGFTFPTF